MQSIICWGQTCYYLARNHRIWQGHAQRIAKLSAGSKFKLARKYVQGADGVEADTVKGMFVLELAAKDGHAGARYNLAVMKQRSVQGRQRAEDEAEGAWQSALELFKLSAEAGHKGAKRYLESIEPFQAPYVEVPVCHRVLNLRPVEHTGQAVTLHRPTCS